jgi:tetratricopeptide (TPR) repeat protein
VKHEGGDLARRWYLALALQSHGSLCLADTLQWARAGLKWFPRDAPLLLAQGTAEEVTELFWSAPVAREWTGSPELREKAADAVERRATLDRAQRSFEEALVAAPDLHEARLRLARVRWRLGRGEQARAPLEALLAECADAPLRHLGHLFLGRIHEDAGRIEDAEVQYRAAALADPGSQVAAVALSHVLQLAGDVGASRQVLADAIARAPRRQMDPFWLYHVGHAPLAEGMFEELRRETLQ